jgi:tetratricopeptide (TPR) repeat protein
MAEHNGGNRGGNDRGPFRGTNNSGGEPRGFRSREDRSSEGPKRGSASGDRKSFGERKPFSGGGENKPYGDRPRREGEGERRSFGGGERKPFSGGGERKPYGDRENKPYGDRPRREGEGERRSFGGGERKSFGDRQDRAPRSFDRGDSGPRQFGRDRPEDRPARVPNARDLRSANRPDRERSPEIDEDVTGKELDRATQHQIKTLEPKSAEWVARHLVMAGRLIDEEPELAFQHALAASRRGGRLAAVREAVGLTAYAAGHYGEALREFRTYRRISGSNVHLPVMADCERGLGRPDRALDVVRSEEANDLDAPGKAELAIVAAGARTDLGQLDAAVAELEIAQLDINRAFSYSPRLFRAYADALAAVGRQEEAAKWQRQAVVAENALGLGGDEEPDIVDLGWDEEEEAREEAQRRRLLERASGAPDAKTAAPTAGTESAGQVTAVTAASTGVDAAIEDVEADYFESDDAESDADSVESDELESNGLESVDASEEASSDRDDAVLDDSADHDSADFDGGNVDEAGHSERQDS